MSKSAVRVCVLSAMVAGVCVVCIEVTPLTAANRVAARQELATTSCNVSPLAPVHESVLQFEKEPTSPPEFALLEITPTLRELVGQLQREMAERRIAVKQTSGYRPKEYQQHFYDISRKWRALQEAYDTDPRQREACDEVQSSVDKEIRKHGLKAAHAERRYKGVVSVMKGQPLVSPPGQSNHEARPAALAVDLTATPPLPIFVTRAKELGLTQPCPMDPVHFSAGRVKCVWTAEITGHSPMRLWLIDPMGRRLGLDPASGQDVNEIGEGAHHSRIDGLETLATVAMPGYYRIGGVGTGAGPYRITLVAFNEAGQIRSARAWTGTAAEGRPLPQRSIDMFPSSRPQPAAPASTDAAPPRPSDQPRAPDSSSSPVPSGGSESPNRNEDSSKEDGGGAVQRAVAVVCGLALAAGIGAFLQRRRRSRRQ